MPFDVSPLLEAICLIYLHSYLVPWRQLSDILCENREGRLTFVFEWFWDNIAGGLQPRDPLIWMSTAQSNSTLHAANKTLEETRQTGSDVPLV